MFGITKRVMLEKADHSSYANDYSFYDDIKLLSLILKFKLEIGYEGSWKDLQ